MSNCLQAGGEDMPTKIWVPDLKNYLEKNGWEKIQDEKTGPAGAVVIYYAKSDGTKYNNTSGMHAAISMGDGKICQHNPPRNSSNGVHNIRYIYVKKE